MKQIALVCAAVLIAGFAQAQELKASEVPAVVKESFAKRFPNVKEVKWSKESEAEFEAEFKRSGTEQSVNFDQAGKWLVTETEIKTSELPKSVQAAIAKEFPGYKIEETEKAETSDKGTLYEVELEKGEMNYEVQFSADGKVLKKEVKKEKGDDKD
jgi:hypothetical protein